MTQHAKTMHLPLRQHFHASYSLIQLTQNLLLIHFVVLLSFCPGWNQMRNANDEARHSGRDLLAVLTRIEPRARIA